MTSTAVPADYSELEPGVHYRRQELHDQWGGQRYRGIATCADYPLILLFTGDAGKEHGYKDEFRDDGTFVYTGEGQVGDMEWSEGNKAIRDHKENNDQLHLFEDFGGSGIVSYVGQYEYDDRFIQELPDTNGNMRDGIRFELVPAGGTEASVTEGELEELSLEALYEKAEESAANPGSTGGGSSRSTGGSESRPTRSEVVKRYALRAADGICQGCNENAPFIGTDGEPFLEVHHLSRRSDGGPDHPDNVVALCPNCHRRVHYGEDGDEFNRTLR